MVTMNQKDTTFTKIFVGGLPYHTTDETLRKFFERFGEIDEAVVITDRTTGKSRGYGFVTMSSKEAAQEAIRDPNPVIDGRKANVNLAYLGAKPRNSNAVVASNLANSAAALAAANTVIHLGAAYPNLQTYGLQPLIYPTHNLANNLFSYGAASANQSMVNGGAGGNGLAGQAGAGGANNATTPAGGSQMGSAAAGSNAAGHQFANAYDLVNQYNQIQLEAAVAAAAAAAAQQQSYQYGSAAAGANGAAAANSAVNAAGSPVALSAAASLANALNNPNNMVNYSAYAALAQQAMPSLTAYQQ